MAIQLLPKTRNSVYGTEIRTPTEQPTKTYALDLREGKKRIYNIKYTHVDGQEAMHQAIAKILMTYNGWHDIYNSQYGFEIDDLIGRPKIVVVGRIAQRLKKALLADKRIYNVSDIKITNTQDGDYFASLRVETRFGNIDYQTNIYPWSKRGE